MKNILFADPNRDLLKCYEVLLRSRGFDVATVFDGTQVIEKLAANRFDLALLSDTLPRIGADKLVMLLHEKQIPVLLLANNASQAHGADAALPFPFVPNELYSAVSRLIPPETEQEAGESA